MQSFAPIFGEYPFALERPALQENAILPNTGQVGTYKQYFLDADLRFFQEVAGPAMQRLGIEP